MNETRELLERVGEHFTFPERAFEALQRRRDRKRRNQRITAGVVGTAIFVTMVWLVTTGGPFDRAQTPASTGSTVPAGSSQPPSDGQGSYEGTAPYRLSRIVEGVRFSFRVPAYGWEEKRDISINKSIGGRSQGAEAMIYWTSFPGGLRGDPCDLLSTNGPSVDELASVVAAAPGTRLVAGPSFVMIGGRPAQHVELTVLEDLGCDPGYFYSWRDLTGGALFPTIGAGDSIEVWIIDVDAKRLFVGAVTTEEADSALEREIQRIIGSIRFE